jgi:hypothetical protein
MADATTTDTKPTVEKFVQWVKTTPHDSLIGDSRVAFDAQCRVLDQLLSYLKDNDEYLNAHVEAALLSASQPSVPVDTARILDIRDWMQQERDDVLRRGRCPYCGDHEGHSAACPLAIVGDLLELFKKAESHVTALHAERDRLAQRVKEAEQERDASDKETRGRCGCEFNGDTGSRLLECSYHYDIRMRAEKSEAEAARLRAALEPFAAHSHTDGVDAPYPKEYWGPLLDAAKAALAPERPENG